MRFARPVQEFRKSCTFKDNFVLLEKPDLNMVYTWTFIMTPITSRKLKNKTKQMQFFVVLRSYKLQFDEATLHLLFIESLSPRIRYMYQ